MKAIISNTGPIIAFSLLDRLDILKNLFSEVWLSREVDREIRAGGEKRWGLESYCKASWIKVCRLQNEIDPLLQAVLDKGEASVIQLARESANPWVLIDERKARKIARTVFHLEVIGTAKILIEAKKRAFLKSAFEALSTLRKSGYWLHSDIMDFVLRETGEGK